MIRYSLLGKAVGNVGFIFPLQCLFVSLLPFMHVVQDGALRVPDYH